MIKISHIRKSFDGLEAVENVSLTVNRGSIYGLLGSNGAGKTTLLKLLTGLYVPDEGLISIDGQPVYESPEVKEKIFFIQDTPYFLPHYTTKQMAQFYESIYPRWSNERFQELVAIFQVDVHKKIHRFSKGIQRQVAFILALSTLPEVLILDEPLDGLDPVMRKKVKSLMIDDVAEREMTVLISSHNLREVEDLCDFVGIMHKGQMMIEKDLDDLKSDTHKVQIAFKGGAPIPPSILDSVKVLHKEKRGSILLLIVKGKEEEVTESIVKYQPVIFDILPLTLEEIFIYEMGDVGYAVENILG
ncbi:ABC transporter ATP-binding protein [Cytobacillus solani]|uniref:ABC transporter n=1 Tax=Cytobacillus solani TaxID=1637975 RepID=A0A0Q3VHU2_9BACI|nr:ABC transporter ATP-binding protein [Cytobacillus solani]KOP82919.1 ABC transporter [Bacillus sp. FJAT-21945]KQL19943.1 ABC transporter [Cytobacillus solani]USK53187.1 ABC transporter ATP-binding protein [Cytobacillus solani]